MLHYRITLHLRGGDVTGGWLDYETAMRHITAFVGEGLNFCVESMEVSA